MRIFAAHENSEIRLSVQILVNHLPTPDGPRWLVLRTFGPDKSILDGTYTVPPIQNAR